MSRYRKIGDVCIIDIVGIHNELYWPCVCVRREPESVRKEREIDTSMIAQWGLAGSGSADTVV